MQQTKKPCKTTRATKPEGIPSASPPGKQCTRCGKGSHKKEKCPARDAICHKCQHKGHYSSQCFTKSAVATVTAQELGNGSPMYLDTIAAHSPTTWMATLKILGKEITFKVDTGAAVSAVSKECHEFLGKPTLQKPSRSLQGPDSQSLSVVGQSKETISHKGKSCKQHIFVVDDLRVNLLGLPGIVALSLVARIDSITDYTVMVEEKFPSLFRGLGTLGDPYTIQLKPDAKPKALYTARKVPLRLREAVETELKKMESSRIISRVDVPTPWCSGIVPVPKKSGAVRICVDLKAFERKCSSRSLPPPHCQ